MKRKTRLLIELLILALVIGYATSLIQR